MKETTELLHIHDLHAFGRGPFRVKIAQAFGQRSDSAVADLTIIYPDHAG